MRIAHPRADVERISTVLDGLVFPAAKWQVVVQADWYGADAATLAQLWALPAATYRDLPGVLGALGLLAPAGRRPSVRGVAHPG